ncbi:hypothetical protein DCO58_11795 [Helicobacter saguini]|uniref:Uncharacterized protein n=1 Tax=Helicobacter saguini TaxID=1548018 RepID=A0A347VQ95_9HELI|nr:hypothetical protein [Helicobacter saguini]MWV61028.1 hypothetical protein [Helicobacter saguini]MWV68303.1 hypothetical protein [Helicobacter saguini]MWV70232.1 hypothetical protein [Helicobacter saguini]MWV72135.1 hypothetical protein [Helicobacter saguini]TLD91636.1 hypothetical protein LS64_011640 [Helicobacter saguini]
MKKLIQHADTIAFYVVIIAFVAFLLSIPTSIYFGIIQDSKDKNLVKIFERCMYVYDDRKHCIKEYESALKDLNLDSIKDKR